MSDEIIRKDASISVDALDDINEDKIHEDPAEYVKSLIEFLLGWLINHILKVDGLITKS